MYSVHSTDETRQQEDRGRQVNIQDYVKHVVLNDSGKVSDADENAHLIASHFLDQ